MASLSLAGHRTLPLLGASTISPESAGQSTIRLCLVASGLLLLGLGIDAEWHRVLNYDVGWNLYVSARVLDGGVLYRDLIEVNPPLIFWLGEPIVRLARQMGMAPATVYRGTVTIILLVSLALSLRALRRIPNLPSQVRTWLGVLFVLVLAVLPDHAFGEREHLTLLLWMPVLALSAARLEGGGIGTLEAIGYGALAVPGLLLKPHFALPWLALLLVKRRAHVEDLVVIIAAVVYAITAVGSLPAYLEGLRFVGGAYRELHRLSWASRLERPECGFVGLALLTLIVRGRSPSALERVLGAAMLAFFVIAVVQGKGFYYHYYPALALGVVILGLSVSEFAWTPAALGRWTVGVTAVGGIVGALLVVAVPTALGLRDESARAVHPRLLAYLDQHRSVRVVAAFTPELAQNFPLVNIRGLRWGSRLPSLWCIPASAYCLRSVGEDLQRYRPDLVVVWKPRIARDPIGGTREIPDYLRLLRRDPGFITAWASYERDADLGSAWAYRRKDSAGAGVSVAPPPRRDDARRPPPD
jgi:hypothetical protein